MNRLRQFFAARTRRNRGAVEDLREMLPLPPEDMRALVGPTEPEAFDQPTGQAVFPTASSEQYGSILDFGCGCGRVARKLALARAPMPSWYVGIDLHRGMIQWNNANLAPRLPTFSFYHHDVFNPTFNPDPAKPRTAAFPAPDASVTLLIAWSVFTHLTQAQAEYYLDEVARVLAPEGVMIATWFFFDKAFFPMMQDFQQALYINDGDPTNAVIFNRDWILTALEARGLRIRSATPPEIRGFQWVTEIESGPSSVLLPEDDSPFGRRPPPDGVANASQIGLDEGPGLPSR